MTDLPAWQGLHDLWWDEQREPQPGDTEAAWGALFDVLPVGWTVAPAPYDLATRVWNVSAVKASGTSRIGHMPKVVSAAAATEPAVLVELARCLVAYAVGREPR